MGTIPKTLCPSLLYNPPTLEYIRYYEEMIKNRNNDAKAKNKFKSVKRQYNTAMRQKENSSIVGSSEHQLTSENNSS